MKLARIKKAFLVALVVFFVFVQFARHTLEPFVDTWSGRLLMDFGILVGSLFILGLAFDSLSRLQQHLERKDRELSSLQTAALDIYGDLSLDTVLQKVVDQASQLLEARYGAVAVYDEEWTIQEFITSGVGPEERQRIGPPPRGSGLLGVPLDRGQPLRLAEISRDPRSGGWPEHHPPMHSLLAVPIVCKGPFRGNLYVTEKESAPEFSVDDEQTLTRFATAAAIAIDNAHLHQRLRALAVAEERVRIAREMHDGMAQVLAYVNTKAQAVEQFLQAGKQEAAGEQLTQLAGAAREVYVDVREQILGLRTELGPDRDLGQALREFLQRWEHGAGIETELEVEGEITLSPLAELQVLRIIQEALANVRKHSEAEHARVELTADDGKMVAIVSDDGAGFDPAARHRSDRPRFGIAIMRERAESIGGRFELDSEPGRGTRVRLEVPLAAPGSF